MLVLYDARHGQAWDNRAFLASAMKAVRLLPPQATPSTRSTALNLHRRWANLPGNSLPGSRKLKPCESRGDEIARPVHHKPPYHPQPPRRYGDSRGSWEPQDARLPGHRQKLEDFPPNGDQCCGRTSPTGDCEGDRAPWWQSPTTVLDPKATRVSPPMPRQKLPLRHLPRLRR